MSEPGLLGQPEVGTSHKVQMMRQVGKMHRMGRSFPAYTPLPCAKPTTLSSAHWTLYPSFGFPPDVMIVLLATGNHLSLQPQPHLG